MSRLGPQPDARVDEASAELARIGAEADALEREGKLDQSALDRFDTRMRAMYERHEREIDARHAARVAEIERPYPRTAPARSSPWWVWAPLFGFLAVLVTGLLLEIDGPGTRFVAAQPYEYKDDAVPVVQWLTPFLWLLIFLARRYVKRLNPQLPPMEIRSVLAAALCTAVMAGLVPAALYGWTAVAGWSAGERRSGIDAVLVSIDAPGASSRGCRQYGVLRVGGSESRICVAGLHAGLTQEPGQPVQLSGKVSRFGVLVEEIRPAPGRQE